MGKNNKQVWNALSMVLQFGINMIVPIVMCTILGIWIGNKIGCNWLVIPLFFMGALAGFTNIFRMAKSIYEKDEKDRRNVKKSE